MLHPPSNSPAYALQLRMQLARLWEFHVSEKTADLVERPTIALGVATHATRASCTIYRHEQTYFQKAGNCKVKPGLWPLANLHQVCKCSITFAHPFGVNFRPQIWKFQILVNTYAC
jgi:hypothetical protein